MATLMFSEMGSIKELFQEGGYGQAGPGQFLEGYLREPFQIMDETPRLHTEKKKTNEFAKATRDQDPDFGVTPLCEVLMKTSNAVRYISQFLSFDEEIAYQLGKLTGMSFCPDKKNKRGRKIFSLNGCNHVTMDDTEPKGYYFY